MDILKERFYFSNESNASTSFLIIDLKKEESIIDYQIEMIKNNKSPFILELDARQVNNDVKFYYNTTGKIALNNFLKRRKLNKQELVELLRNIMKIFTEGNKYFLNDQNFILKDEYMFINDQKRLEVGGIYLPLEQPVLNNSSEEVKMFFKELIVDTIHFEDDTNDNYVQKILSYLKNNNFSVSDFDKFLEGIVSQKQEQTKPIPKVENPYVENFQDNTQHESQKPVKHENLMKGKNLPKVETKSETKYSVKKKYKKNIIMILALSQVLILLIITLILLSMKTKDISTIGGIGLVFLAGDVLLLKKLLDKKNLIEVKIPVFDRKVKNDNSKEQQDYEVRSSDIILNKVEIYNQFEDTIIEEVENKFDDTVVLDEGIKMEAYIIDENDPGKRTKINKNNFFIGRLQGSVDFVIDSKAVSKVHAEVLNKNGGYYIKDLNSKNGIFINEKRVQSNVETKIKDKDKISIANINFIFKVV